ncbi:hypothetical protein Emed_002212 [Eimeria media]
MREAPRQPTLQELRRKHLAGSLNERGGERGGSLKKQEKEKPVVSVDNKRFVVSSSLVSKSGSISKAQRAAKKKRGSKNSKTPQEFSCRVRASPRGALVVPEGEREGPLLLAARPATTAAAAATPAAAAAAAVSPEVEAYRAAVAAYQLKRIRGGVKHRSGSARSRDPRFSDLCGELNVASCSKAYSFVDEQQQQLKQQLQRIVKTGRMPKSEAAGGSSKGRKATAFEREQASKQLQSLESQQQQRERRAAAAALKASLSRAERERIAATGKRPHYVSKKKFRELLREQQQQSSSNKMNIKRETRQRRKALAKERKRNNVPQRRDRSEAL